MSYNQKNILKTRIDNITKDLILSTITTFLEGNCLKQITTLNPEILLKAYKNKDFRKVLNESDLNIADGIGIKFAFWRYSEHLKTRYTGADLMWDILKIANAKKMSVCLVAKKDGLSTWQETRDAIQKKYSDLKISGNNIDLQNDTAHITNCEILITNLGAPHQEMLISKLKHSPNISLKLGIGVGGSFDYITRKIPRAPKLMRNIGLEWVYRLCKQPHRISRIFNAVVVFPMIVLFTKEDGQMSK